MLSMTGFGRGVCEQDGCRITVRITTVNRKGLDIRFRLPRELAELEPQLRETVAAALSRGAITVTVDADLGPLGGALYLDAGRLRGLVDQLKTLQLQLQLPGELALRDLLTIPDLFAPGNAADQSETALPLARRALGDALGALAAMRAREGEALAADLLRRLETLVDLLQQIRRRAPDVVTEYRQRLQARIAELADGLELDDDRLAREVALFADRSDVTEECIRLDSHLQQLRDLLQADGAVGRKLDFLLQEHFREINTIGSKAADAAVARLVVDFKTELERIREQVQNVE